MKKISIVGTGYVGLSLAVLLVQHNKVTAVDIIQEKVDKINARISPIQDKEIEDYPKIRPEPDGYIVAFDRVNSKL